MMKDINRGHDLGSLSELNECRTKRVSSYDRSGGNHDWMDLEPGECRNFADIKGPGIIRHIWCTNWTGDEDWQEEDFALRRLVLRIYWDEEETPSVEVPLGDFFGIGFGMRRNYSCAVLSMNPDDGRGMNCYFPMPFSKRARMTIESNCLNHTNFYFYVDYEEWECVPDLKDTGYFHAQWRREEDTRGWAPLEPGLLDREKADVPDEPSWIPKAWMTKNRTGEDNYVVLEAAGRGKYVGCNLNIDVFTPQANEWYGEGDDMFFIDGEPWPPSLHGTGTEDYFSTAFGPAQEYHAPYSGITIYSGDQAGFKYGGKNSMYRYHVQDPICFEKSLRFSIEHGHANKLSNDYSSTAYWYQTEPHAVFPELPSVEKRLPRVHPWEEKGKKAYQGIIFDLDGVLCFTDKYHYQAWKQVADRLGIPFDETVNNRLRGVSRMESLEIILEGFDGSMSQEEKEALAKEKNAVYREYLNAMTPRDMPDDVRNTLKDLRRRGILLAVGSSSKNAGLILERLGMADYFDAVSDGNQIQKSKPDPEVFCHAAKMLGLTPKECLVVEDAEAGIQAAQAGGFDSAGIGSAVRQSGCTYLLREIGDLCRIVR